MARMTSAVREPLIDPIDQLQLALDVAAVPHHPLDSRLHEYQRTAVQHLYAHPRAGLFMIPGAGKTATTLSALTEVHLPALVIAPKLVIEKVWPVEIEKWRPDLTYSLARGDSITRKSRLTEETDIHLITWDTFGQDMNLRKPSKYKTVILDELSKVKNRSSQRWRYANRLVRDIPYVWGLTGTPAPNSLLDLWSQVFLLDRGARLGRTLTSYRTTYFVPGQRLPNGIIAKWTMRPGADDIIHGLVSDICMSVPRRNVQYPAQIDSYHRFQLPPKAKEKYELMEDAFIAEVAGENATVQNAAAKTTKLSQIASGFMYQSGLIGIEESEEAEIQHVHNEKLQIVQSILDDAQGAPALIFYRYTEDRRRLLQLDGAVDIKAPHSVERWNRGNIPILIAQPQSAGHGLNLQHGGSLMIWYGLTWSSEDYTQGTQRLVRPGQPSEVVAVHHILAKDTVDELMVDVVQGKINRQDALLKILER